ncbi:MAG: arginyltransferase [Gammaproteobacteria bacterium]|nr:arginyltransferase [Gammaproteobacteria bacterium]
MMMFNASLGKTLFFATEPQVCSYLEDRKAVMLFADPRRRVDRETFARLIDNGFRRSGDNIYRPHCPGCNACVPVRLSVKEFTPDRSQRRCWNRNQDLQVTPLNGPFTEEHETIYQRYQAARHDSEINRRQTREQLEFLRSRSLETSYMEFRDKEKLLAVAAVDHLPLGWSAVYTFFDPDCTNRGLGTFAVLWEVDQLRQLGLEWLYLGYWIENSPSMHYKKRFRPLEMLQAGKWVRCPE